jgi:hypothetical protein
MKRLSRDFVAGFVTMISLVGIYVICAVLTHVITAPPSIHAEPLTGPQGNVATEKCETARDFFGKIKVRFQEDPANIDQILHLDGKLGQIFMEKFNALPPATAFKADNVYAWQRRDDPGAFLIGMFLDGCMVGHRFLTPKGFHKVMTETGISPEIDF